MKKFLSGLFLLLFSVNARAEVISSDFTDNTAMNSNHDLSISYLSQVFGTVGNVLHGTTGQMLGKLFYKLNEGIIVVAGLWLAYTVFTVVLRAAQDGSFMGPNKNAAFVFLKIAFGFSLLIPNPATGYSLLQDVVMKIVVEGVGLADQTWEYGLKYINEGGSVWHRPESNGAGNSIVSDDTVTSVLGTSESNKIGPGQQIFANAVCMYSSIDSQPSPQLNNDTGVAVSTNPPALYSVIEDDKHYRFAFPGVGDSLKPGQKTYQCGTVSWDIKNACQTGSPEGSCEIAKQAVSELVTSLMPAAKKYYCSQNSSANSCIGFSPDNVSKDNVETFFGGLLNYVNTLVPLVQLNTSNATSAKDFIEEAQTEGWLSAGRYYWDLSQVQSHYNNISNVSNYIPTVVDANTSGYPDKYYQEARKASLAYIQPVLEKLKEYRKTQNSGDTGSSPNPGTSGLKSGVGVVGAIFGGVVYDIGNLISTFSTSNGHLGTDPILFLHNVGMRAINVAADIWFGFLVTIAVSLFATGVCTASYNAQTPISALLSWVKPLLMVVAGGLWGAGFVLAYYVPLYPYFIYTFGVIGWIIVVIEAMVAAPLICFGLTHPEGHDFLGEAKQALMLLLGVFLRPVLMVIGLIAGMVLSYVSLRIIVYTFSGLASDLFASTPSSGAATGDILSAAGTLMWNSVKDSGSISGVVMSLLVFPLVLVIFTMLVYVVTTQCFSLIFALPDNVLRWIGSPPQSSSAAQMAHQVQGYVSGFGQTTHQGISQGSQAVESNSRSVLQQQKQAQLKRTDSLDSPEDNSSAQDGESQ